MATYTLLFKISDGVSYAHQACINLVKKKEKKSNILAIAIIGFLF